MSRTINPHGVMLIGKAERPGPSLSSLNKDKKDKSKDKAKSKFFTQSLERKGLNQMIDGILHNKRRQDAIRRAEAKAAALEETASLSSFSTDAQSLPEENETQKEKDRLRKPPPPRPVKLQPPRSMLNPRLRVFQ